MKFHLEIECGNAAFGDGMSATFSEIARILGELRGDLITRGYSNGGLRDYNGNLVGKYWFTGKRNDD